MDMNSTSAASKKAGGFKTKKTKQKQRPDEIDNIVMGRVDKTKEINEVIANLTSHPFHFESAPKSFIIQSMKEKSLAEISTKKNMISQSTQQFAKIVSPFLTSPPSSSMGPTEQALRIRREGT